MDILGRYREVPYSSDQLKVAQKQTEQFASLQPKTDLPDWLTRHPDDLMQELRQTYNSIPYLESARPINRAYNQQIDTVRGTGGQAANAAAMEAINRGAASGGQVNSSMVKAQTMLPVYDQTSKLEAEKAAAVTQQHHMQAQMMSTVAAQMAQLRTSYLANLGQLQLQRQQQSNQWVSTQEQQGIQLDQMNRLATLQSSPGAMAAANAKPITPFSGMMTRAKNDGGSSINGTEFTPEFLEYLKASGNMDIARQGPMQYPLGASGGIGSGPFIDKYQAYLRNLSHVADPRVPAYNVALKGMGERPANFVSELNPDRQSYAGMFLDAGGRIAA